jgi:hypothetical protein
MLNEYIFSYVVGHVFGKKSRCAEEDGSDEKDELGQFQKSIQIFLLSKKIVVKSHPFLSGATETGLILFVPMFHAKGRSPAFSAGEGPWFVDMPLAHNTFDITHFIRCCAHNYLIVFFPPDFNYCAPARSLGNSS